MAALTPRSHRTKSASTSFTGLAHTRRLSLLYMCPPKSADVIPWTLVAPTSMGLSGRAKSSKESVASPLTAPICRMSGLLRPVVSRSKNTNLVFVFILLPDITLLLL